jgi:hypothetical protein
MFAFSFFKFIFILYHNFFVFQNDLEMGLLKQY